MQTDDLQNLLSVPNAIIHIIYLITQYYSLHPMASTAHTFHHTTRHYSVYPIKSKAHTFLPQHTALFWVSDKYQCSYLWLHHAALCLASRGKPPEEMIQGWKVSHSSEQQSHLLPHHTALSRVQLTSVFRPWGFFQVQIAYTRKRWRLGSQSYAQFEFGMETIGLLLSANCKDEEEQMRHWKLIPHSVRLWRGNYGASFKCKLPRRRGRDGSLSQTAIRSITNPRDLQL